MIVELAQNALEHLKKDPNQDKTYRIHVAGYG